jgi:hypothetical protein
MSVPLSQVNPSISLQSLYLTSGPLSHVSPSISCRSLYLTSLTFSKKFLAFRNKQTMSESAPFTLLNTSARSMDVTWGPDYSTGNWDISDWSRKGCTIGSKNGYNLTLDAAGGKCDTFSATLTGRAGSALGAVYPPGGLSSDGEWCTLVYGGPDADTSHTNFHIDKECHHTGSKTFQLQVNGTTATIKDL